MNLMKLRKVLRIVQHTKRHSTIKPKRRTKAVKNKTDILKMMAIGSKNDKELGMEKNCSYLSRAWHMVIIFLPVKGITGHTGNQRSI